VWNDSQVSDLVSYECCIAFCSILLLKITVSYLDTKRKAFVLRIQTVCIATSE
jgi:hypothetical protein